MARMGQVFHQQKLYDELHFPDSFYTAHQCNPVCEDIPSSLLVLMQWYRPVSELSAIGVPVFHFCLSGFVRPHSHKGLSLYFHQLEIPRLGEALPGQAV